MTHSAATSCGFAHSEALELLASELAVFEPIGNDAADMNICLSRHFAINPVLSLKEFDERTIMSNQTLFEFSQPIALRDISAQAYVPSVLILHESLGVTRLYRPELNDTLLLGGTILFEAENKRVQSPEYHAIRIQFHGGANRWMIETERFSPLRIYPRDAHYGLLHDLMREFEMETGLSLPAVRIAQLGQGFSTVTAQGVTWDANNPWAFEPGAQYTVQRGKESRSYCARHNAHGKIEFFHEECPQEGFDPTLILDCKALASLKKDGLPVFDWKTFPPIEKDEGTPSRAGGMRR